MQLSPKPPFKKHYDDLYVILKNKATNENTVNEAVTNSLYSDTLVQRLLKQLLSTTPLWNGFLLGDLQRHGTSNVYKLYGQYRAANPINMASQKENLFPMERLNGAMEKRMSVLYNNQLERKKLCRVDDFVILVFDDLLGMNRMFGDSILSRTSKSVRNKKVIKEEWNKQRITKKEKPSYQIGSGKSETIKILKSTQRKNEIKMHLEKATLMKMKLMPRKHESRKMRAYSK